jgi:hypothetical protein
MSYLIEEKLIRLIGQDLDDHTHYLFDNYILSFSDENLKSREDIKNFKTKLLILLNHCKEMIRIYSLNSVQYISNNIHYIEQLFDDINRIDDLCEDINTFKTIINKHNSKGFGILYAHVSNLVLSSSYSRLKELLHDDKNSYDLMYHRIIFYNSDQKQIKSLEDEYLEDIDITLITNQTKPYKTIIFNFITHPFIIGFITGYTTSYFYKPNILSMFKFNKDTIKQNTLDTSNERIKNNLSDNIVNEINSDHNIPSENKSKQSSSVVIPPIIQNIYNFINIEKILDHPKISIPITISIMLLLFRKKIISWRLK